MKKLIEELLGLTEAVPKGFAKAAAPEVKPKTVPPAMREKINRLEELLERLKKDRIELERRLMEELHLSDLPSNEADKLKGEIKEYLIKEQIAVAECERAVAKLFAKEEEATASELIQSLVGQLEESILNQLKERAEELKKVSYIFRIGPRKESIEESVWSKIVDFVKGLVTRFRGWLDSFSGLVDKLNRALETV